MDKKISWCRCCLQYEYPVNTCLRDLYKNEITYADMLEMVTGLDQSIGYANYLCDVCELELIEAYDFRKKCVRNHKNLLTMKYLTIETKPNEKTESRLIEPKIKEEDLNSTESNSKLDLNADSKDSYCELEIVVDNLVEEINTKEDEDGIVQQHNESSTDSIKANKFVCNSSSDICEKQTKSCDVDAIQMEEFTYECIVCSKIFNTAHSYEQHYENFHEVKPKLFCSICNLCFEEDVAYRRHMTATHDQKTICPQCGKTVTRGSLRTHLQTHNVDKKYSCKVCNKKFKIKNSLFNHMRIHSNDLRYECEFCGKKFMYWKTRRCHVMAEHTGEKNYECHMCDKKFTQKINLTIHLRKHTGESPYECKTCLKKFMDVCTFKNHLAVHSDEKNEKCEICHKTFKIRKYLRSHMKIHNKEKDYICWVCTKPFSQAHLLRTHLKTHPGCPIPPSGMCLSKSKFTPTAELINSFKTNCNADVE